MIDREYDIAFLEIKIRNDELTREWLLHKMGRRAEELLNAVDNGNLLRPENAPDANAAGVEG